MSEQEFCKCQRCGRIRPLFQYTKWEADRYIEVAKDNGAGVNPQITIERVNLADRRGLCEECSVEVNKAAYDQKCNNACNFNHPTDLYQKQGVRFTTRQ